MPARGLEPPVSEAELHGFVDGGLDRGRREAVQAFLATSPADAARVETWRRQNERIRAAFATMEILPPPWTSPYALGAKGTHARGRAAQGSGQGEARARSPMWRERWSGRLIGPAFAAGVVLTASADYIVGHVDAPDGVPFSSGGPAVVMAGEATAERTVSALEAFDRPSAAATLPSNGEGQKSNLAVPVLPNVPVDGFKLAGIRTMPGEDGQMLCMFYAKPDTGDLALCAEKTPGPRDTLARVTGNYPSASIYWRQEGANYVLSGALHEPELRVLADEMRTQVEAFARYGN